MTIIRNEHRRRLSQVAAFFIALLLLAVPAMAQSPIVAKAPLGVRTFVANIALPRNVVRTHAVIELTRQTNWLDAPASWDWEHVMDSAGFVQSVNVYVTLNTKNTTKANGTTICCWTYAETSIVVTDDRGALYTFPLQVYAR